MSLVNLINFTWRNFDRCLICNENKRYYQWVNLYLICSVSIHEIVCLIYSSCSYTINSYSFVSDDNYLWCLIFIYYVYILKKWKPCYVYAWREVPFRKIFIINEFICPLSSFNTVLLSHQITSVCLFTSVSERMSALKRKKNHMRGEGSVYQPSRGKTILRGGGAPNFITSYWR